MKSPGFRIIAVIAASCALGVTGWAAWRIAHRGPEITGISIGASRAPQKLQFTITFTRPVKERQDWAALLGVRTTNTLAVTFAVRGNTVQVSTVKPLARCTAFTVTSAPGILAANGGSGTKPWHFTSRTLCQQRFVLGESVRGRPIYGYRFGSGKNKVIFTGAIHGNEKSAAATLRSFMDDLETHPAALPKDRTIEILPILNPDGYAANQRTNAHNVDLNRNFPAANWKQTVSTPRGPVLAEGGGSAPFSEPEATLIANYIVAQKARLVISYHSKASAVIANGWGSSLKLAEDYARLTGYKVLRGDGPHSQFNYDTTGSLEDWLNETPHITALLIELSSSTRNEYSSQKAAIHAIAFGPIPQP